VRFLALAEGDFPVERFPGLSSPRVGLGEGFPECNWSFLECILHPEKTLSPVVDVGGGFCLIFSKDEDGELKILLELDQGEEEKKYGGRGREVSI
jgi:hypothetical protein